MGMFAATVASEAAMITTSTGNAHQGDLAEVGAAVRVMSEASRGQSAAGSGARRAPPKTQLGIFGGSLVGEKGGASAIVATPPPCRATPAPPLGAAYAALAADTLASYGDVTTVLVTSL